jgi:16S rRNA (guanine(966)-N(2))-methyltransferase RsmD
MRIIGGQASGITIFVPKGLAVRPTPDIVRQAVFNSLGERVIGTNILELFGGSGALSLESLSRGATRAVCVELNPHHSAFIRKNLAVTKLPASALEIRTQDVFAALRQFSDAGQQFDLILADPPYGQKNVNCRSESLAQQLLDMPELRLVIKREGIFVLGHSKRDTLTIPPEWHDYKMLRHGDSIMRFMQLA